MIKRIETVQFEANDGKLFDTEADALAHEAQVTNYDASSKEVIELLTKAQVLLDTKPELNSLKQHLRDDGNRVESVLDAIHDFNENSTNGEDYQNSYYSSNC